MTCNHINKNVRLMVEIRLEENLDKATVYHREFCIQRKKELGQFQSSSSSSLLYAWFIFCARYMSATWKIWIEFE
jgi:hypothetical protein